MPEIVHIAAECFPFAKVGGLADVVGALPKYQNKLGSKASVVLPYYANTYTKSLETTSIYKDKTHLGNKIFDFSVLAVTSKEIGFPVYLVKVDGLTDREQVYGYIDDTERFFVFQLATLHFLKSLENIPDVIHCHDHHTGLIPFLCAQAYAFEKFKFTPTVITIHNAQYQGEFGYDKHLYFPEYDSQQTGLLDWYGKINPLAAAIKCAWRVTTVSPSYMEELKERPSGLEGLLNSESIKCQGILNGIDDKVWNPKTDTHLIANFSVTAAQSGRKKNKAQLCHDFKINPELPMIAFIGRFVYEKGSDLLAALIDQVLGEEKLPVSLLILGSGDPRNEYKLNELKSKYKGSYDNYIGYSETLAHQIYGGADFLLMPSRVEPCGLNQMYAMRYGMIPITSNNGGLKDTVLDFESHKKGSGIVFGEVGLENMISAIARASKLYQDKTKFKRLQKQLMQIDHSWDASAQTYHKMYTSLIEKSITHD